MLNAALVLLLPLAFEFNTAGGLGSAMMAGVAVPLAGNASAVNPGLAEVLTASSIEATTARLYDLSDVYAHQIAFGLRGAAVAGRLSLVGTDGYQEFAGTLVKGFRVTNDLSFGAAVALYLQSLSGEYVEAVPVMNAGMVYCHGIFGAGAALSAFNRPSFLNADVIPPRASVGASLTPYPNLRIAADCSYDHSLQFRGGAAFVLHPALTLAIGMGTDPLQYAGGLRVAVKGIELNYTYAYDPHLRQSHIIGLGYSF